jgi:hypothetical protein
MNKLFAFAFSFLLFGCTTPPLVGYIVDLQNTCDYPVQINVPKYCDTEPLRERLNSGDVSNVMRITCGDDRGVFMFLSPPYKELQKCFPNDYILEINANGNRRSLNNVQFLEALKQSSLSRRGDIYIWTINASSLCPGIDQNGIKEAVSDVSPQKSSSSQ